MVRVAVAFLLICAFVTFINTARADGLFQESLTLRNGQVLVVEESALEPRSIGSYSLRLYSSERPEFPYDRFITGLVFPREGILEAAAELNSEHCDDCFMICIRSVGTGNHLMWHIYSYADNHLVLQSATTLGGAILSCDVIDQFLEPAPKPAR